LQGSGDQFCVYLCQGTSVCSDLFFQWGSVMWYDAMNKRKKGLIEFLQIKMRSFATLKLFNWKGEACLAKLSILCVQFEFKISSKYIPWIFSPFWKMIWMILPSKFFLCRVTKYLKNNFLKSILMRKQSFDVIFYSVLWKTINLKFFRQNLEFSILFQFTIVLLHYSIFS